MKRKISEANTKCLFSDTLGLSNEQIERYGICLYHGIRFDAINRLESIFQTGFILPGEKVKRKFTSYDGTEKYLYINDDSDENCNKGKYVSVMPDEDEREFKTFVREHLFFAIKGTIKAFETKHVSYYEYLELKDKDDNYYSYAFNEYFVEDGISLKDVVYIGIDPRCYRDNYDETVEEVIKLMKHYKIDIPFIETRSNYELFRLNGKRLERTR